MQLGSRPASLEAITSVMLTSIALPLFPHREKVCHPVADGVKLKKLGLRIMSGQLPGWKGAGSDPSAYTLAIKLLPDDNPAASEQSSNLDPKRVGCTMIEAVTAP
jgi:hypothetical protein